MKTTNNLKVSALLITLLLSIVAPTILSVQTANASSTPPNNIVDHFSTGSSGLEADPLPYLLSLGYSEEEVREMSSKDRVKIFLSDGGKKDLDVSMEQICLNLFGNNTGFVPDESMTSLSTNGLTLLTGKACFVASVWDYLYPVDNQTVFHDAYTGIMYDVNLGGYNYVKSLTNESVTQQNVYQWITWLCASYANVDIYLIGEGVHFLSGEYAYCCYDCRDEYGCWNTGNVFYAYELESYGAHNYDYSTLRLGVGGFCYGGTFDDYFLDEGTVWIGSDNTIDKTYVTCFLCLWGYYWYPQNQRSDTAFNNAHGEAQPYVYGLDDFDYHYSGTGIYH